jgi:hypothetical protein
MVSEPKILRFFLGTHSPVGFVSRFDQITNPHLLNTLYVLKGGPGSGKSTLLKKVGQAAQNREDIGEIEYIHCASDLKSLDAVVLPDLGLALADGTPPHVIEPKYPGLFERLVALGDCYDTEKLTPLREEIIATAEQSAMLHRQADRFMAAAAALLSDNARTAERFTDMDKVRKTAARIAARSLKPRHREGSERVRFLSALTDQGYHTLQDTGPALADSITLLEDDYAVSAPALLKELRQAALEAGYDIISCYSPLAPMERLEHLFIPELSLGFMTHNRLMAPDVNPDRIINARRFTDTEGLRAYKKRMAFCRKAAIQMLGHAEDSVRQARELHHHLEALYRPAMDYEHLDSLTAPILKAVAGEA